MKVVIGVSTVLCTGALLLSWMCSCDTAGHRPDGRVEDENQTSVPARTDAGNSYAVIEHGAHYPDLPDTLDLPILDLHAPLLRAAASRAEIVAWAEKNGIDRHMQSIRTGKPNASWLIITDIWTSGSQSWMVLLYAYYPIEKHDAKPWKLMYLGGEGLRTQSLGDMGCIYIDTNTQTLVVATTEGNEVHRIPIGKELSRLRASGR